MVVFSQASEQEHIKLLEARVEQLQDILRQQTSATSFSRTGGIPDPRQALMKQFSLVERR